MGLQDEFILNAGITITNSGAQYAVVTRITGLLTNNANRVSTELQWSKFIIFENAGVKGENFKPHGSFAGWSDYMVIPSRQAVSNTIQFNSRPPFVVSPGRYTLLIKAYTGSGDKVRLSASTSLSFEVNEQKAKELVNTKGDPETKISKGSVQFGTQNV
jgi:hypothetical protein